MRNLKTEIQMFAYKQKQIHRHRKGAYGHQRKGEGEG